MGRSHEIGDSGRLRQGRQTASFNRGSYDRSSGNLDVTASGRCWLGAAVAHTRRNRTLEKSEILRLTAYGLNGQFTLSAKSRRSLLHFALTLDRRFAPDCG